MLPSGLFLIGFSTHLINSSGSTGPISPSCRRIGFKGSSMNARPRCSSLVWDKRQSQSVCCKYIICGMPFLQHSLVVTASSTINDVMSILTYQQLIPVDYHGIYTLSYGRTSLLCGSSTMVSLGIGSLSHLYLRICVYGGASKWLGALRCEFC